MSIEIVRMISYGPLGTLPRGLVNAPQEVVERWKRLSDEAEDVMRMKAGDAKERRKKDIETRLVGLKEVLAKYER